MKKSIIIFAIVVALITSFLTLSNVKSNTIQDNTPKNPTSLNIEKLTDNIDETGLYKIVINDSTTILLYKTIESSSMIQVK